jgi:P27 family predicted phage terminase small subunit
MSELQIAALSQEARGVYGRLQAEWRITDGAGEIMLLTFCQALDRLRDAQRVLKAEGITTVDRWGQKKNHPAATVEREARSAMIATMRVMNLDLESLEVPDKNAKGS